VRVAALLTLVAGAAGAQHASFPRVSEPARSSIGFMLGAPTGLTFKRWLGGANAFDLNAGFALAPGVRFSADYLFGIAQLPSDSPAVGFDLYAGVGPLVGVFRGSCGIGRGERCDTGDIYAGGRVPFGIEAVFRRTPLAVGFEIAPGIVGSKDGPAGILDVALTARLLL